MSFVGPALLLARGAIAAKCRAAAQESLDTMNYDAKACAKVADVCYAAPERRPQKVTVDWDGKQDTYYLDTHLNDTECCVYASKCQAILGFKGTNCAHDVNVDVQIVRNSIKGVHSENMIFEQHDRVIEGFEDKYRKTEKLITGHSLGGLYAVEAAEKTKVDKFHVFNSAPTDTGHDEALNNSLSVFVKGGANKNHTHHHIYGDVISAVALPEITKTYSVSEGRSRHSMSNFCPDSKKRKSDASEATAEKRRRK